MLAFYEVMYAWKKKIFLTVKLSISSIVVLLFKTIHLCCKTKSYILVVSFEYKLTNFYPSFCLTNGKSVSTFFLLSQQRKCILGVDLFYHLVVVFIFLLLRGYSIYCSLSLK